MSDDSAPAGATTGPDQTIYNGSSECSGCGTILDPVSTLYAYPAGLCWDCRSRHGRKHLEGLMV